MRIRLVRPVKSTATSGNTVTADRWRRILTGLGHHVDVAAPHEAERTDEPADVLVALHAHRSADAIDTSRRAHPDRPIVVALTGTDLYRDLDHSSRARRSVALADRLVVLQPRGRDAVPASVRDRVVVVPQSLPAPTQVSPRPADRFAAIVLAHLRDVKDPLLTARAVRLLPTGSRVQVCHLGAALDDDLAAAARRESRDNPRYDWRGECPREEALRALSGSHALILTSQLEGGANVVSEAIVCGVPVLATRVDGSVGMLGDDYPGLFPVGDAAALARLLQRAEHDEDGLYDELERRVRQRQPDYDPEREREAWAGLLAALR